MAVFFKKYQPTYYPNKFTSLDASQKLLLHMNGTDGSTTFTDSSSSAKTITANGDAQIDTAQSKFGGASGLFDGTGDYLSVADSEDWYFGTGDFTIDFWVRFNGTPSASGFLGQHVDSSNFWTLSYGTTGIHLLAWSGGVLQFSHIWTWTPSADTWYHIAAVRNGTNFYAFIDGTSLGTKTGSNPMPDITAALTIADNISYNSLNGWMDELRILKGTAAWTSNFTPPTSEYT